MKDVCYFSDSSSFSFSFRSCSSRSKQECVERWAHSSGISSKRQMLHVHSSWNIFTSSLVSHKIMVSGRDGTAGSRPDVVNNAQSHATGPVWSAAATFSGIFDDEKENTSSPQG
jgi:hypothetical protein